MAFRDTVTECVDFSTVAQILLWAWNFLQLYCIQKLYALFMGWNTFYTTFFFNFKHRFLLFLNVSDKISSID